MAENYDLTTLTTLTGKRPDDYPVANDLVGDEKYFLEQGGQTKQATPNQTLELFSRSGVFPQIGDRQFLANFSGANASPQGHTFTDYARTFVAQPDAPSARLALGIINLFENDDKAKLDAIEAGAQVNVKPDWNAPAGDAAEILNKPTLSGGSADLVGLTDTEIVNVQDGEQLAYSTVDGKWKNVSQPALNGFGLTEGNKGDLSIGNSGSTFTLNAQSVTNVKLDNMAESTLKGRGEGAGPGVPQDLTAGKGVTIAGTELQSTITVEPEVVADTTALIAYTATLGATDEHKTIYQSDTSTYYFWDGAAYRAIETTTLIEPWQANFAYQPNQVFKSQSVVAGGTDFYNFAVPAGFTGSSGATWDSGEEGRYTRLGPTIEAGQNVIHIAGNANYFISEANTPELSTFYFVQPNPLGNNAQVGNLIAGAQAYFNGQPFDIGASPQQVEPGKSVRFHRDGTNLYFYGAEPEQYVLTKSRLGVDWSANSGVNPNGGNIDTTNMRQMYSEGTRFTFSNGVFTVQAGGWVKIISRLTCWGTGTGVTTYQWVIDGQTTLFSPSEGLSTQTLTGGERYNSENTLIFKPDTDVNLRLYSFSSNYGQRVRANLSYVLCEELD